ncbi:hypothetical protein R5M92_01240 [Halomonas sp. Bachu 37]|uniref:hypothetical protein n=1 Tax=Halomonas kashgarensis TaxID=3084920 RepID=UPI00321674A6
MRDLYQRLALAPDADEAAIGQALSRCQNSALKQDGEAVLQEPERRAEYDRLHATLSDIGRLRARLGLSHGAHWQGNVANDFSLPPDNAISRHDELVDRVSHAVSLYNRWRLWRGSWSFIALIAIGAGIGLGVGFALGMRLGTL